jgi:hypothetical protein
VHRRGSRTAQALATGSGGRRAESSRAQTGGGDADYEREGRGLGGFATRAKLGAAAAHRIRRRAMETGGFSPTRFLSFLRVLIRVKTSFLEEETISSFFTLSLRKFLCHVSKLLSCQYN